MTPIKPPNSLRDIGPFGTRPLSETERTSRASFALLWKPTIDRLAKAGWETHPGSVSQLYVEDGPSKTLAWALASPSFEFLYVRLNFVTPTLLRAAEPEFHGLVLEGYEGMRVTTEKARRASGIEWFLEARIGLNQLFENCTTASVMESRLADFVVPLIDRAARVPEKPQPRQIPDRV